MRIGYFSTEFPYLDPRTGKILASYPYGGVENGTYQLAKQMAKKGHDVFVFTTSSENRDTYEEYGNIHIYRYSKCFSIGQAPISLGLLYMPIFSGINLDIVHARLGNLPAPLTGYWYSKWNNVPCVVSYHADWDGSFGSLSRRVGVFLFNHLLCDYMLSNADKVIALSEEHALESKILSKYLDNLVFIPNGLNLEEFETSHTKQWCRENLGLSTTAKIILFVGSLNPIKAPDVLIKSMKTVLDSIPDAYLVIVGTGPYMKDLEIYTSQLQGNNVIFVGAKDPEDIPGILKSTDIFVNPSYSEGLPTSVLEACAAGCAVVATDVGGTNEIIHDGSTGFLVHPGDQQELTEKINLLIENKAMRETFGRNAKAYIMDNFSWDQIIGQWMIEMKHLDRSYNICHNKSVELKLDS